MLVPDYNTERAAAAASVTATICFAVHCQWLAVVSRSNLKHAVYFPAALFIIIIRSIHFICIEAFYYITRSVVYLFYIGGCCLGADMNPVAIFRSPFLSLLSDTALF